MKLKSYSVKALKERQKKVAAAVKDAGLDSFLITNPKDIYYLTGVKASAGALLIKRSVYLYLDNRYFGSAKKNPTYVLRLYTKSFLQKFIESQKKNSTLRIGFDADQLTHLQYLSMQSQIKTANKGSSRAKLVSCIAFMKEQRQLKEKSEIKALIRSANVLISGFDYVKDLLSEGISEKELSDELEMHCKGLGAQKMAFETTVAFGKNSAFPHHRAGDSTLKKNDIIQIDAGVSLDGYMSDMSRVFFVGKPTKSRQKIYEVVKVILLEVVSQLKPGASVKELNDYVKMRIKQEKYGQFLHSLGHGVGLDVHELPAISSRTDEEVVLEENMVITIEPGIYIENIGGARLENMYLITKSGAVNLCDKIPL